MQIAEVVRTLGLCSVLGLAGFAVGCGSDGGQGSGRKRGGSGHQRRAKECAKEAMKGKADARKAANAVPK